MIKQLKQDKNCFCDGSKRTLGERCVSLENFTEEILPEHVSWISATSI